MKFLNTDLFKEPVFSSIMDAKKNQAFHSLSTVYIQLVRQSDIPRLATLYLQAYSSLPRYSEPNYAKAASYLYQLYRQSGNTFYQAQVCGVTAGFVVLDPNWMDPSSPGRVMEVHELVVAAGYQGSGLGSRLLHFAMQLAGDKKRRVVSLWAGAGNTKALACYRDKFGFVSDREEGEWVHLSLDLNRFSYG